MLSAFLFFVAFVAACILALVRHPIYGLMAYIGVFYVSPPSRWWDYNLPSWRWSLIAAAVTFLALLVHRNPGRFRPLFSNGFMVGLVLFIVWLFIQDQWALDQRMHDELITYYVKFAIAVALIYKCIENEGHVRMFLWSHVLGAFYFGWVAYTSYGGGRFESFGGPGFSDANYAAVHVDTALFCAAALLLAASKIEKIAAIPIIPFVMNGLVTTVSRSGFLTLITGGFMFVMYAPKKYKVRVSVLGLIALVAFMSFANDKYWDRISTIMFVGEEVEGVDTGAGRLDLMEAQWRMFKDHPLGCGHRCTATLSGDYLDDKFLTGRGQNRARSSHNTFMSLLVEQGVVGAVFYGAYLIWLLLAIMKLRRRLKYAAAAGPLAPLARVMPAVVAVLVSVTVAELFVDYLKLEVRLWFVALLMVLLKLTDQPATRTSRVPSRAPVPPELAQAR